MMKARHHVPLRADDQPTAAISTAETDPKIPSQGEGDARDILASVGGHVCSPLEEPRTLVYP